MATISLEDTFQFHGSVLFGLRIDLGQVENATLGCTLRFHDSTVQDLPAHTFPASGLVLWQIEAPPVSMKRRGDPRAGWSGYVIFALWRDASLEDRLADTDWIHWTAPWLIGASTAGLNMQDDRIEAKYSASIRLGWRYPSSGHPSR